MLILVLGSPVPRLKKALQSPIGNILLVMAKSCGVYLYFIYIWPINLHFYKIYISCQDPELLVEIYFSCLDPALLVGIYFSCLDPELLVEIYFSCQDPEFLVEIYFD